MITEREYEMMCGDPDFEFEIGSITSEEYEILMEKRRNEK